LAQENLMLEQFLNEKRGLENDTAIKRNEALKRLRTPREDLDTIYVQIANSGRLSQEYVEIRRGSPDGFREVRKLRE
jgi:hypothetical protein